MKKSPKSKKIGSEQNFINLDPKQNLNERIDYIKGLIEYGKKRLELIDSTRNTNLNYAFVVFIAALGASIQFLSENNTYVISAVLLLIASAFLYRDFQLHKYSHGWVETARMHFIIYSDLINNPENKFTIHFYYKNGEAKACRCKEWRTGTRLGYYLLILGSFIPVLLSLFNWKIKHL